jgi:quercetin dioxygenase-like cupin family protein
VYSWETVAKEVMNPTFTRQVIHTETMTIAHLFLKKGCLVPDHSHINEQVTMVKKGCLRFMFSGREQFVRDGDILRIPPNVPHSAEAVEDTEATDLFSPCREDWIRGDDAYLRK